MKKQSSKSVFTKKNKTVSQIPESKQNSRITKTNSCIKINSLNSEQCSKVQPISQTTFVKQSISKKQSLNYPLMQIHHLDKPNTQQFQSGRNKGKSSVQTIPIQHQSQNVNFNNIQSKNQQLSKENSHLKQKCFQLQEMSIRDKEKIKNLIIRINEVKQINIQASDMKKTQPSNALLPTYQPAQYSASHSQLPKQKLETPYKVISQGQCQNRECLQRKKYLQSELYRQRISRDRLQMEKKEWERNREQLKQQYSELLLQIRQIRDNQY